MTEQQKTSEQIQREAMEEAIDGLEELKHYNIFDSTITPLEHNGYVVASLNSVIFGIKKALKEADKAESVSDSSNRELKRYFDGQEIGRSEVLQKVIEQIKIKKEALPIHLENMHKKKPSTNSKEDDEMFMNLIIGASNITLDFVLDLLESEMK